MEGQKLSLIQRITVSLGLIALIVWVGWGVAGRVQSRLHPEPARAAPPVAVETLLVRHEAVTFARGFQGTVQAEDQAVISARIGGVVREVPVREGQSVARGEILAVLDDAELRQEMERLQAIGQRISGELELARTNLEREEQLYRQGGISQATLDATRQRVQSLEAQQDENQTNQELVGIRLGYVRESAPFAGLVQRVFVTQGEYAGPGQPLVEVVSLERLKVVVSVPQSDAAGIRLGQAVRLMVPALNGQAWEARVDRIVPTLEERTRSLSLTAFFPDQARGEALLTSAVLRPGMAVTAHVHLNDDPSPEQVIMIPARAVRRDKSQAWAFVLQDGRAVRRELELGPTRDGRILVQSGLQAGEVLITTFDPRIAQDAVVQRAPLENTKENR